MRKSICIIVTIILISTLIPTGRAPGTPYTVRTHVTLDGSPVSGATVKVTLTKPDPNISGYATYIGDGDYDANLGNPPYDGHWANGDPVRVDVTYGDYYAWDTGKVDVFQGYTYFNIALNSSSNNSPPSSPTNPSPANGAKNVSLNPTLSVYASDPDGDVMNVYFYNASDNSLIGIDKNVASGSRASIEWSNLAYNTTYSWYAIADDGTSTNKSSTWSFTTVWPPHYVLTVSISPEGSGSVSLNPDKSSYGEGEKVTLTASPNEGYVFDRWSGDLVGTNAVKTITVYGNKSIIARFKPINYTLNVSVEPSNAGYVSLQPPGGSYSAGTNVTLTAVANASYVFDYWSGDISGSENPVNVTMDSNKTVVAHFLANHLPDVEIIYPLNNSTVSGIVIIHGKASDTDGNETLQRVEVEIDDGEWHNATGTVAWNFSWNTTEEENGNHTIRARAYDGISYSNISEINVTIYNNEAPSQPCINGTSYGVVGTPITFYVLSTDPDNDTIRYGFDWDNDSAVDEWTTFYPSGSKALVNHSWNETGSYSFKVIAEDEYGMQSEWRETSIRIFHNDATPPSSQYEFGGPTANITYGGYNYTAVSKNTSMWINVTDDSSGVAWLNYSVWWNSTSPENYHLLYYKNISDNDANDTDGRVGFISAKLNFNEECFHEIRWHMADYMGNEANESLNISVDSTAPTIVEQVGEPKYVDGNGRTWVNCTTPFWFNITDSGCGGGVGVWKFGIDIYWNETEAMQGQPQQFTHMGTIIVEDGGTNDKDGLRDGNISYVFYFSEEGFYELHFWAEDYLGNKEDSYTTVECYLNVSLILTFGEPKHGGWISPSTPINISILNKSIDIYYRVYIGGEWHPGMGSGRGNGNNFYLYDGNFTLSNFNASHGRGFIEFYANGTGLRNTSFKVDVVPPSTYFVNGMPFLVCGSIFREVAGSDDGCGVERVAFYYRYSCDNATWGNWTLAYIDDKSPFSFNFSGDVGFYELSTVGTDFLGNEEDVVVKAVIRIFSPDINSDGRVNVLDIVKIACHWQENSDVNYGLDLNGDGIIGIADLVLVGQHWTG